MKKRTISILLCISLVCSTLFLLSACENSQSEKEEWMPFGLQFGMTYDSFGAQLTELGVECPELEPADSNPGYVTNVGIYLDIDDPSVWSFLDSEVMEPFFTQGKEDEDVTLDDVTFGLRRLAFAFMRPCAFFSFNQDKELYEFYMIWTIDDLEDEENQLLLDAIKFSYDKKFGFSDEKGLMWETDTICANVRASEQTMSLIVHDKSHNLDSKFLKGDES